MLRELEVGDSFRISQTRWEVLDCKVICISPSCGSVMAYVEQYGESHWFDSDDLVEVDQVQETIHKNRDW